MKINPNNFSPNPNNFQANRVFFATNPILMKKHSNNSQIFPSIFQQKRNRVFHRNAYSRKIILKTPYFPQSKYSKDMYQRQIFTSFMPKATFAIKNTDFLVEICNFADYKTP